MSAAMHRPDTIASRRFPSRHGTPATRLQELTSGTWKCSGRASSCWSTCHNFPTATCVVDLGPLQPNAIGASLVEAWRGAVCHVGLTDGDGKFAHYKVIDPSFHNWIGLAMSLREQQISDFPLCNKSFNLSYCGHDL